MSYHNRPEYPQYGRSTVILKIKAVKKLITDVFIPQHFIESLNFLDHHIPYKTVNIGNKPWRIGVWLSQILHWPMDKTFGATEIFHATNHLLAHFRHARTVYTLHDLIFLNYPEYHKAYNRWYLTLTMPLYLKAADIIVTPSECSKQDAIKYYGLPESKIKVIYEAPAPTFKPLTNPTDLERVRQTYHLLCPAGFR